MKSAPQLELERSLKVDRQRLQEFINELTAVPDSQFVMTDFDCGSAACIMGWWKRFEMTDEEYDMIGTMQHFANETGVELQVAHDILTLHLPNGFRSAAMAIFDALPPADRKACAIRVLELLMESGQSEWVVALNDTLSPEQLKDFMEAA